jgi:hypothetical protein
MNDHAKYYILSIMVDVRWHTCDMWYLWNANLAFMDLTLNPEHQVWRQHNDEHEDSKLFPNHKGVA